jgi:hypothetical protein
VASLKLITSFLPFSKYLEKGKKEVREKNKLRLCVALKLGVKKKSKSLHFFFFS